MHTKFVHRRHEIMTEQMKEKARTAFQRFTDNPFTPFLVDGVESLCSESKLAPNYFLGMQGTHDVPSGKSNAYGVAFFTRAAGEASPFQHQAEKPYFWIEYHQQSGLPFLQTNSNCDDVLQHIFNYVFDIEEDNARSNLDAADALFFVLGCVEGIYRHGGESLHCQIVDGIWQGDFVLKANPTLDAKIRFFLDYSQILAWNKAMQDYTENVRSNS